MSKAPGRLRFFTALAVLALFAAAFLYPGSSVNGMLALLVKGQFSALWYGGTGFILVILVITLICGRFYCSVFCPLGFAQELIWRAAALLRRKKPKQKKRTAYRIRYAIPLLAAAAVVFSFTPLMLIFDPVSTFGRGIIVLRGILNSGTAGGQTTAFSLALAVPLALILIAAVFRGRAFCDWCPAGITQGLFSQAAPLGMKILPHCVSCGICEAHCPAGCIDSRKKHIDSDRCVLCFSCSAVCPSKSAVYGLRGASVSGEARRVFLKGAGRVSLVCGAAYLLAPALKLFPPAAANTTPILPPGAKNLRHYTSLCIGCHACAASCPVGVLKTKTTLNPEMDYTGAACQFNCVECGQVCPTGAITRLDVDRKHRTRIALSTLYFERCVVKTKHQSCGACAEVCPTGALTMTAYAEPGIPFLTKPVYDERYCIGCGACLAACPAEPRAFTLAAVPEQTLTIGQRPPEEAGDELQVELTDEFPF
jgi:ferredoxin